MAGEWGVQQKGLRSAASFCGAAEGKAKTTHCKAEEAILVARGANDSGREADSGVDHLLGRHPEGPRRHHWQLQVKALSWSLRSPIGREAQH